MRDPASSNSARVVGQVTHLAMRPEEGWSNADGSRLLWRTLLSADRDGPASMCAGVAEVPVSSDALTLHRHAQDELYFVVSGHGEVKIDDMVEEIGPGSCVFVPRNSWHTISNPGPDLLQLFRLFPDGLIQRRGVRVLPGRARAAVARPPNLIRRLIPGGRRVLGTSPMLQPSLLFG